MSVNNNLIKGLEARYLSIKNECAFLESKKQEKGDYKNLYTEVSFFIHYILKNRELELILNDLLSYSEKLKLMPVYLEIQSKMEKAIQDVAKELKSHVDYKKFIQTDTAGYSNPFRNPPITKPDPLLTGLESFKFNQNVDMYNILDTLISVLSTMIQRWIRITTDGFDSILVNIQLLHNELRRLDELLNYEHDYIGSKSAKDLFLIYRAFRNSLRNNHDPYEGIIFDLIKKGEAMGENTVNDVLSNTRKVFDNIQNNLGIRLSIEVSIERYSLYTALYSDYKIKTNKVEKALQNKFEEFAFREGYFPISEANFKNGRIDTLLLNENNSFLCEFKQVNLSKKGLNQAEFEKKMKAARIQSNIYFDYLKTLSSLNRVVFLIVFTNERIDFKNNIDRLKKNGIEFIIKPIYISGISPSKVNNSFTLDVNSLIG